MSKAEQSMGKQEKTDFDAEQLAEELAEAKEQLLEFFDRFGEIYCWELARKARIIALIAMVTNVLVSINAGFIAFVRPEALSLNYDIAEWAYDFTAACAVYYFALMVLSHLSYVFGFAQKAVLYLVLASLVVTLSIFSSLIGFFDSLTWFIFFLYTMLGFVLLDWRQVVITDTCIVLSMMCISVFHKAVPFPVQAYLFSEEKGLASLSLLDLIGAWSITATAAFAGMWIMSFLLRNWHAHGVESVSFAHLDPLTKVMKRSSVLDALENEVNNAAKDGEPLTLAIIDLDKFKQLNSEHGHVIGDRILAHFARQLRYSIRDGDLVGRYGGQEFIVVFPRCRSEQAKQVLERLLGQIKDSPFEGKSGEPVTLCFSVGVAYLRPGDSKYENVIARADRALTKVKAMGGKRILVDGEDEENPEATNP